MPCCATDPEGGVSLAALLAVLKEEEYVHLHVVHESGGDVPDYSLPHYSAGQLLGWRRLTEDGEGDAGCFFAGYRVRKIVRNLDCLEVWAGV